MKGVDGEDVTAPEARAGCACAVPDMTPAAAAHGADRHDATQSGIVSGADAVAV